MRLVNVRGGDGGTGFVINGLVYLAAGLRAIEAFDGWPWSRGPRDVVQAPGALDALARLSGDELLSEGGTSVGEVSDVDLGPPIAEPAQLLFAGLNYREHAAEIGVPIPRRPHVFAKLRGALSGPTDPIVLPAMSDNVDHEVELAVVVKSTLARADPEEVGMAIAGYLVVNDVSARDWQFADDAQLVLGKGFRTFCPCGPALVTPDEVPALDEAQVTCRVNGEVRQMAAVSELIFGVNELLSFLSHIVDLHPGDIVSTGTPSGVEQGRQEPLWLQPGDLVECAIDGIGTIRNTVEREQIGSTHE
jgi:2-keto-4-pentenoate hydratase/2-oxohepta-3-ene-1,7-dioic acid hydratase in catechol pathway